MSRRLFSIAGSLALTVASAGIVAAQDTKTTTTTSSQTTKTIQNPDGSYTVIQYPADKEVTVQLSPGTMIPGATGNARVLRHGDATTVNLDLANLTGDMNNFNVYAVDQSGALTLLGPVTVENGIAKQTFTTPLDKFMIVLSPEANLTAIADNTPVLFRSAVPQGFAVVPLSSHGERDGAAVGERVSATSTAGMTSVYNAPMLGIPGFRRGTDTEVKIKFSGELNGTRANVYLEPRKDGPTTIKMRFHELKYSPAGKRLVVWAVSPDNKFVRLGQIVNTVGRNEAQIQTETALQDFGLFITTEDESEAPRGQIIGTVIR